MRAIGAHQQMPGQPYALLHPVSLMSLGVLIVNDHVLKAAFSNTVTGKVSDIAGMVFFPLLVATVVVACLRVVRGGPVDERRIAVTAIVGTALVFGAVNLFPFAEAAYEGFLSVAQTPLRGALRWQSPSVDMTRDPTDLIALVFLVVPWFMVRGVTEIEKLHAFVRVES